MKIIYVAGKYRENNYSGISDNIMSAKKASLKLYKNGWGVFTPHMNMAHLDDYDEFIGYNISKWLEIDFEFLKRSDAIFFMKGYEFSPGSKKELAFAKQLKKPIFFETDGIPFPEDIKINDEK